MLRLSDPDIGDHRQIDPNTGHLGGILASSTNLLSALRREHREASWCDPDIGDHRHSTRNHPTAPNGYHLTSVQVPAARKSSKATTL